MVEGVALAEKGQREKSSAMVTRGLTEIQSAAKEVELRLHLVTNLGDPDAISTVLAARAWAKALTLEPALALRPVSDAPIGDVDQPKGKPGTRPVGYAVAQLWAEVIAAAATSSWAEARRQRALAEAALLGVALGPLGIVAALDRLGVAFPELGDVLGLDALRQMRDDAVTTFKWLVVAGALSAIVVGGMVIFLRR